MQLYYTWIKDFKNIKEQGFSFTDKYFIDYDDKTGILLIKENTNFIHKFFGDNITSITGIIGANGAGKSNLLEFLKLRLATFGNGSWTSYEFGLESLFVFDNKIFIHTSLGFKKLKGDKEPFKIFYYNNSIAELSETKKGLRIQREETYKEILSNSYVFYSNIFDLRVEYDTHYLIDVSTNNLIYGDRYYSLRYRSMDSKGSIDHLSAFQNEEIKRQLDFLSNYTENLPFNLPNTLTILIEEKYNNYLDIEYEWYEKNNLTNLRDLSGYFFLEFSEFDNSQENLKRIFSKIFLFKLLKILAKNDPVNISKLSYSDMSDFVNSGKTTHFSKAFPDSNEVKKIKSLITLFKKILHSSIAAKRSGSSQYNNPTLWEIHDRIHYSIPQKSYETVFNFIRLYNECVKEKVFLVYYWEGFSSGQLNMLTFFSRLHYAKKKDAIEQSTYVVIMIDEGETYFHPAWQKEFLYDTINYLKRLFASKQIQIILTSNSPFIVSDLPKSMINFLDRDQEGNCIVIDGLYQNSQTFGANIHTLYTDGFFMPNNLVGNFAKSKLDKLIKIINKEKDFDDEISSLKVLQQYINIIGEPIIKSLLQRQLDSIRLQDLDNVKDIKAQIDNLDNRLKNIERKNDTN